MKYSIENLKRFIKYHLIGISEMIHYDKDKIKKDLDKQLSIEQYLYLENTKIAEHALPFNNMMLHNNKWGAYKLKDGETYTQSIYRDVNTIGFHYMTPKLNRGVIGYPEVSCGTSPWGGKTTDEYFPIRVKDIKSLSSTYDVDLIIQPKKYNLVYDLWLSYSKENKPSSISHEIMVWEDRNVARPYGKLLKTIKTSFGKYKVYHGYMDRSEEQLGTGGWYFTAFVRQDRRRNGIVDIKELLYKMGELELISGSEYLCGVEFGTEVYNSCGYCFINKFEIEKS